jgi:signal peptidase
MLAGAFQVAFLIGAGMVFGFGHSPFGHTTELMAKNGLYIVTMLAGLESARAYLLHTWGRIHAGLAFAAVALMFAAVTIAPAQFDFPAGRASLEVVGVTFMPAVAESVMATFLASIGGPLASFAYVLTLYAFDWFSPILPSLDWTVEAFVKTLAPVVAMLIVRDTYDAWNAPEEEATDAGGRDLSPVWIVAGVLIVAAIWLNAGMLGGQPAVVSGNSMQPELAPYDLVFTREVDPADLKKNDIIRYQRDGIAIMHRILEIPEEVRPGLYRAESLPNFPLVLPDGEEGPIFLTKGDANERADPPVAASQIEGRIVFTVPKGGWVPNKAKELIQDLVP